MKLQVNKIRDQALFQTEQQKLDEEIELFMRWARDYLPEWYGY